MKDDNADGPEHFIDMKTVKLCVVRHLYDNDLKRFSLMRLYWRYIAGTCNLLLSIVGFPEGDPAIL